MHTSKQLEAAVPLLRSYMHPLQLYAVLDGCCYGEEKEAFIAKLCEMADLIRNAPKTYEQDGLGDEAIAYLHYFKNGCDWYITELDIESEQLQAFGLADLGGGGELGYISIVELLENEVELDLYFEPTPIKDMPKLYDQGWAIP